MPKSAQPFIDFEKAIIFINTLSTDLALMELLLASLIELCNRLLSLMNLIHRYKGNSSTPTEATQQLSRSTSMLRNDILYTCSLNEALLRRIRQLQQKIQIQLTVVNALIAQRDNIAIKSDSTSMKSIAVLTMFFLPSTLVASLFSMPLFNWNAGPEESVTGTRAWIYLAVTLPLTAFVLCLWWLWSWYIDHQHSRKA
ncbi:hypothetical protein CALVIDRAFT_538907 [Calocera viscosa TUFC12733]|uniref:Cora-domain-containing protein n=1 Tax=Calocera viscosa (strain TUFC12733) TaxID=1330018 RepID=A0A167KAX7_CALVF|nr:hypothetical protein CALVIDRAFT_538907 [Calocera viscosa TUFC12733]